jgi:hypothetical protein
MARPAHGLIRFSGIFKDGSSGGPIEQWVWGLRTAATAAALTEGDMVLKVSALKDLWSTQIGPHMPSYVTLTEVAIAAIGADGKQPVNSTGGYVGAHKQTFAVNGSRALSSRKATQDAVCVTLTTGRAGPTGKGRIFLPCPSADLGPDLRLDVDEVTALGTGVRNMLENLRDDPTFAGVVVASSLGFLSPVTGIKVGRVVDTMRSRRRSLHEDYVVLPLSA